MNSIQCQQIKRQVPGGQFSWLPVSIDGIIRGRVPPVIGHIWRREFLKGAERARGMFAFIAKGVAALLVLLALFVAYSAADYLLFQKPPYEDALDKMNHMHGVETCREHSRDNLRDISPLQSLKSANLLLPFLLLSRGRGANAG